MQNISRFISNNLFHHRDLSGYFEPVIQVFKPAWRSGFFRAKVKSIRVLSENALKITLKPEKKWPIHTAGQHISLTIEQQGRLISRVFTIASGAKKLKETGLIDLVIRTHEKGNFTSYLGELVLNSWVNISNPKGEFTFDKQSNHTTFLAGGSGITPFIAMLEDLQENTQQHIHLLYYAKPNAHLMVEVLEKYMTILPNFSFELLNRSEHGSFSKFVSVVHTDEFLVCGPEEMFVEAEEFCKSRQIPIRAAHFQAIKPTKSINEAARFTVKLNHGDLEISNQDSLLSEFQSHNKPVKYGCGMGICHQCQCVKKKGIVRDMRDGRLSDNSEELIQLCVTQAVTDLELEL
jgi:ferredoxin-NADP reductase